MTITWNGKPYINEEGITPEQYKTFFAIAENGIKYSVANAILGHMFRDGADAVVPYDELNAEAIADIAYRIHFGLPYGVLRREGQKLCWEWRPELRIDGEEAEWGAIPVEIYEFIADQLLNGNANGRVEV